MARRGVAWRGVVRCVGLYRNEAWCSAGGGKCCDDWCLLTYLIAGVHADFVDRALLACPLDLLGSTEGCVEEGA